MKLQSVSMLIPDWALPWIAIAAALAFLAGALRLSFALGMVPVVKLVIAPALAPFLASLPGWMLPGIVAGLALLALHGAIGLVFGRETAGHFTGTILVRCFDWLLTILLLAPRLALRSFVGGAEASGGRVNKIRAFKWLFKGRT